MNVQETFKNSFAGDVKIDNDFSLIEYDANTMIGIDRYGNTCVVIKSLESNPISGPQYKTQKMSIECNMNVQYTLKNQTQTSTVHILRCLSNDMYEKDLFLELAMVLIQESEKSKEDLLETFFTLKTFFQEKKTLSDNELTGLYAELYTICSFHDSLDIEKYWQSHDRMKFDFSFSDKLKLDIKATTKNTRKHHFLHEQLMTELYDIYVLSYQLQYDDEGLSLYDLLQQCKTLVSGDSKKLLRIDYVLKDVNEERLRGMRFNQYYTELNRHFYRAADIPKFDQNTPNGVSNAEYDSVLDNVDFLKDDSFIDIVSHLEDTKDV